MPDNKKNPQQDQQRKGQEQQPGQEQDRQKQGDRGQPGFNEREDRMGRQNQNQIPDGDQEMDRLNQGANQDQGKQGVTEDEDFDQQETENERVTQRNPQQGEDTPKPDRK